MSSLPQAIAYLRTALDQAAINTRLAALPIPAIDHYSPWQVETLLNQAQDLLERCQREKMIHDEYWAKWISTGIEYYIGESELAIQEETVSAGEHRLQKDIEAKERDAETQYQVEHVWAEIDRVLSVAIQVAIEESNRMQRHNIASDLYKTRQAHLRDKLMLDAREIRERLAESDANRLEKGMKYRQEVRKRKNEAINNPGGPYYYQEKCRLIEPQIASDFLQAVGRVEAAFIGLNRLFGYGDGGEPGVPAQRTLEEMMQWVRQAISWLVRFTHREHSFSVVLSVKALVANDQTWRAALASLQSTGRCALEFAWNTRALDGFAFARIAGIGASYVSRECTGILQMDLSVPRDALSYDQAGNSKAIDQRTLSRCRLGRVGNAESVRPLEFGGAISQRNASPLSGPSPEGKWQLAISVASDRESDWKKVDEVEIELQINALPR